MTKAKTAERVQDLARNDLEGAKRFITARGDALTTEEAQTVLMLQDNPRPLEAWMSRFYSR